MEIRCRGLPTRVRRSLVKRKRMGECRTEGPIRHRMEAGRPLLSVRSGSLAPLVKDVSCRVVLWDGEVRNPREAERRMEEFSRGCVGQRSEGGAR